MFLRPCKMRGAYLAGLTIKAHGNTEVRIRGGEETGEDALAVADNQTCDSDNDARSWILGLIHRYSSRRTVSRVDRTQSYGRSCNDVRRLLYSASSNSHRVSGWSSRLGGCWALQRSNARFWTRRALRHVYRSCTVPSNERVSGIRIDRSVE